MTCIGLIGSADDAEVALLARRLGDRGAEPWIVDLARFPADLAISADGGGFRVDGRPLPDMHAAYLRRVGAAPERAWIPISNVPPSPAQANTTVS